MGFWAELECLGAAAKEKTQDKDRQSHASSVIYFSSVKGGIFC